MSGLIKPFSEIIADTNGVTTDDITTHNYPALVYAWTSDYGVGSAAWTDRIAGAVFNSNRTIVPSSDGAVTAPGGASIITLTSPTYPGTSNVLWIQVGYLRNTTYITMGDPDGTGPGIGIKTDAIGYVTLNGTNYVETPAITASLVDVGSSGSYGVRGLTVDWDGDPSGDGSARTFIKQPGGSFTYNAASAASGTGGINAGVASGGSKDTITTAFTDCEVHAIYMFNYTSPVLSDADLQTAVDWMQANPLLGLHPILKKLF